MMPYHYHTFGRKTNARIFVKTESDIWKVKEIIRKMDEDEYEYLPGDLIAVYEPKTKNLAGKPKHEIKLAYTYKFDALDLNELAMRCFVAGIPICIWENGTSGDADRTEFIDVWEDEVGGAE